MAKQSPSLYSISKTFFWFAIASIVLTLSLGAIVWTDYNREWKVWQKKFFKLKADKAAAELKTADAAVDKKRLEELKAREAAVRKELSAQGIEDLRKKLSAAEAELTKVKKRFQDKKQLQDSYRYFYEEHVAHHDGDSAASYKKKLDAVAPQTAALKLEVEALESRRDAARSALDAATAKEKEVRQAIDKLLEERSRVQRRLDAVKPSVVKDVLNAPMLDFIAPTLEVRQIVLDDLFDDYHFAKTQKVDRCTTCHLGIDQKGFEDAPQPFRTHPDLELYLGASSPHPVEKFGCTVCHSGNGHSVSFKDAAHTPRDPQQAAAWQKAHGWKELEKWEHKMLPAQHVQAACAKCHAGTHEVPKADKLNQGRKIAETMGCFNCHKIDGFEGRWKVGPELDHVALKVDEEWIAKWLQDPRLFRPGTQMPRVFHLSNTSSHEDRERNDAAIRAIAAYLTKMSEPLHEEPKSPVRPPVAGNATRGEQLVKTVGCTGCHTVAGVSANSFGPDLTGLGSKVSAEWLYTWLKDPKHVSEETRMPDLRLTDQEAADITAYLLRDRNAEFEALQAPAAKPEVVDALVLENLQATMRRAEAETELAKMSAEDRLLYLGKRSIAHQGCFGCHSIKGFEDAKPIGTELTKEGSKDLHQFDFGFVHEIPHTRHDWIAQKLREPRIFDRDKVKGYYEKLRMPRFNFSDEEIDALTTFVLSLTGEQVPMNMRKNLDSTERRAEEGRLLVSKLNCTGCHSMDGKTGALRAAAEDPGAAPPILEGEGAKVQEAWLHDFLHRPTTIRPWLTYRMPTFGFSEEELSTLVHMFAHLAGEEVSYRGNPVPPTTPEKLAAGRELVDKLSCTKCHQVNAANAAMGASFLAPDLRLTKHRLKPDWVREWVADPQKLEPGTMMPTFFPDGSSPLPDVLGGDAAKQIEAIRDYLYVYETAPSREQGQA